MARKRTSREIPAKGRLRDMADRLWSVAVRSDWANKCAVCGKPDTDAHHLIPRQHEATRYELRNGIALCQYDHIWNPDLSPHQDAAGWINWLKWHHPTLADWYVENRRPKFEGTVNAAYFCDVIRRLGEYVEPDDFSRIVGVKFSRYLLEVTTNGGVA